MSIERFSLENKVALVTGASRGIGRAIAIGFAEAGADVAVAARTESDLETLAKEIDSFGRKALVLTTDVRDRDAIQAMFDRTVEELGDLDILVNNAGGSNFMSPLVGLRPEGWDKLRTLNLDSVFHCTQIAAQKMVETGGGSIIQIASVAGLQGAQGLSPYSAAKAGVIMFSQAVAKELAGSNVRVNSIAPGWIDTPLNEWMTSDEAILREAEKMVPMGRIGEADEIVGGAIYLASDASSFVTGATLVIDGGQIA
ncbi:MAG TPA: SDR family NAD(P)-dependent oxidoreductase [Actinomycetota bacterium]|nr:SDR family NAD(P)-dependent oxidoreductase [Actinomycetota bacterium]